MRGTSTCTRFARPSYTSEESWPSRIAVKAASSISDRGLSSREDQHAANHDCRDADNWWHPATFLRSDFQRADLDFVPALGIWYSAHRDDGDAGNDEKHADPAEWPHDDSRNGEGYICCVADGFPARTAGARCDRNSRATSFF